MCDGDMTYIPPELPSLSLSLFVLILFLFLFPFLVFFRFLSPFRFERSRLLFVPR